ncbi:MAG TPA: hypothetical protein VFB60_03250 [Ktedonobacteraceae bacterium]|nr:hypothetical protein [Ktedonobacteraceae bacterium]
MIQTSPASFQEILQCLKQDGQPGQYLVAGTSGAIDPCVRQLLDTCASQGHSIYYFLCSGSQPFHVPCYLCYSGLSSTEQLPSPDAILDALRNKSYTPQNVTKQLERIIVENASHAPPIIIIECITPPQTSDSVFIEQLLAVSATRGVFPVALFLHQYETDQQVASQPCHSDSQESTLLLHLCGGRVRAADWERLTGFQSSLSTGKDVHPLITTRSVGAETWFCHAGRQVAEQAAAAFSRLEQWERERLIRKVLQGVQSPTDYPALALAIGVENLELPLTRRAFPALERALTEPRMMSKYFFHLRRYAKHVGDTDLTATATLNYIASLLCLPDVQANRLYNVLCHYEGALDGRSLARLYGELGQRLVKGKKASLLEAAAGSFQRSRRYLDEIEYLKDEERLSATAAIANGEALLACKRGQPEIACQIETDGLAGLQQVTHPTAQEVLLRTNLGDLYLRMLGNPDAAMQQYLTAYRLAIKSSSIAVQCYIAPKLAELLIQKGQQEQAIEILEMFLARRADGSGATQVMEERTALKAQLNLAQAYWQIGHYRRAAFWYWRLLRRPHSLAPTTLRGIVLNLQHCRPAMSQPLSARMGRIIANQEHMLVSIKQIRNYLIRMSNQEKEERTCRNMM